MSKLVATDFSETQSADRPHDLLARLYREIGISAVAAALEVMTHSGSEQSDESEDARLPAILLEEQLAA
ncbi:hypothetical protein IY145_20115 [Methylosinus sp. H3A]|uniref:hypothetical protein n=1 Tax=Methylosinus sp. H3A TaxID=2785786 RepID=UPI0018C2A583|nr:hypothetical protein [Methylosinus sp. H3A]MBG0811661.1 hypothetical protein [Methylosinus sp. H3A]